MDFNSTIDLIIKDLNEAREIIDHLKKYPGVPAIQVELAKSKCKSAGEVIALLKSMKSNHSTHEEIRVTQTEESFSAGAISVEQHGKPQEKDNQAEVRTEITITSGQEIIEDTKHSGRKTVESTIIADKFNNMSTCFNEQLGGMKHEDDVSEILKTKHVTDLSEAIGVNDRFLFIREIFDGNQESYNQVIMKLDNIQTMNDARAIIMSYTGEDEANEAVKQLLDLVKRKLP